MADHNRPYGVGLAYRPEIHQTMMRHRHLFDMLEIAAIDYTVRGWRILNDPTEKLLREAVEHYPSCVHATSMSIGSVEDHDQGDVNRTLKLMDDHNIVSFSEHLAFHRMDGLDLKSFLPMPFDSVSVDWVARKYNAIRSRLSRPFALENVSYLVDIPDSEMDEADFLIELTRRTDCMLLLDVTNVFNNASNFGYDPYEFIRRLPGDRIEQLHIAGGHLEDGQWIDSHSAPVMDGVWGLLDETLKCTAAEVVILEKDINFLPFETISADLKKMHEIFYRNRPRQPDPGPSPSERVAPCDHPVNPIEPDNPEFADLRSFQRAMIKMITDKPYRRQVLDNPGTVQQLFPMSDKWQQRLIGCSRRHYDSMASGWRFSQRQAAERDADVKRKEWRAWSGV